MFYSHTFLARKGPLGTVWCAAHLHHRLKKSQYTSVDIISTADTIMFPEVPIALRMSGFLMYGLVRVYSKKVDYLHHDCNHMLSALRRAFSNINIDIDLPENATTAPPQSLTLPERCHLDALDFNDYHYSFDHAFDNHLRNPDDITLTEQIPVGTDAYVAISFDEDIMMDSTPSRDDLGARPMEEDILRAPPFDTDVFLQDSGPSDRVEVPSETAGFQDPGASNRTEIFTGTVDDFQEPGPSNQTEVPSPRITSPLNVPEIEALRDAGHDLSPVNRPPLFSDHGDDAPPGQILNGKETLTPILEDVLASGEQTVQFQQRSEPPASAFSQDVPEIFDVRVSFGHSSPQLAIRSTPPVQKPPVQKQKPRAQKRKLIDESIVLSNKFMKKALEDPSDILRKKRNLPSTAIGVWRFKNHLRKEQVFHEPLVTGLCIDICNMFEEDYISSIPHLVVQEGAIPDPMDAESPTSATEAITEPRITESSDRPENIPGPTVAAESSAQVPDIDMEIERLRYDGSNIDLPEFMSSSTRDNLTPFSIDSYGSRSVPQTGTTIGTAVLSTPGLAASTGTHATSTGTHAASTGTYGSEPTGTYGSELETPMSFSEDRPGLEYSGLFDIPELVNSADAEDLYFLEADSFAPTPTRTPTKTGSQAGNGVDTLSVRTRAFAQYLKRHSPIPPIRPSSPLSLNKILEGRTRKLCARMFYETLVLKNFGFIDVQQEEAYGDITLELTDKLSKAQI